MERFDIINNLIRWNSYKSYLEIGFWKGDCYRLIECENKECCDPQPITEYGEYICTYKMTSDEMFSQISPDKKWDIIFIDGLHISDFVMRDIVNSLRHLNPGGKIVVHDSLPATENAAFVGENNVTCNGTVFKTIASLSEHNINFYTVNTDQGCCVIDYYEGAENASFFEPLDISFEEYFEKRKILMNIVEIEDFIREKGNIKRIPTISTCLIVKNEAACIERCIKSIQSFSDEIIIYDTGSNDGTQDICRSMDKVTLIQGEWRDDFAWARNKSFEPAKCDYIMWVDADDVVDEETQNWLCEFKKKELSKYGQVNLEYIYDMAPDGSYTLYFQRERIFRRSCKPMWFSRIHEYPAATFIDKSFSTIEIPLETARITHFRHNTDPMRNLLIYRDMEAKGEMKTGRDWFYYARECMWHDDWKVAIEKFKIAIERKDLWNIDRLNAYMNMASLYAQNKMELEYIESVFRAASCTKYLRADVCCALAGIYRSYGNNKYAKELYKMALEENGKTTVDNTFMTVDNTTIIPALELCVLEYNDGNIEEAKKYNDIALGFEPDNKSALYNKQLFESLH